MDAIDTEGSSDKKKGKFLFELNNYLMVRMSGMSVWVFLTLSPLNSSEFSITLFIALYFLNLDKFP